MSDHAPGPWELGGCSGRMVKPVAFYGGDGFIADVDTLANARLIAASPTLLEACKRALHIVGALADGGSMIQHARRNYDPAAVALALQSAIAKSERHYFTPAGHSTPAELDECKLCGHDIRDDVHFRANETASQ